MEKNRVLNHSLSRSPSLFDAPGTEAFYVFTDPTAAHNGLTYWYISELST